MLRGRGPHYIWISALAVLVVAVVAAVSSAATEGSDTRVTTHDIISTDPFGSATPPTDVLQQNEPSIAIHPANADVIAVGVNDVRTVGISDDAWQGLSVSSNGGTSFDFEALIPGFPGDTSPDGLASPIRGNAAASDPWLGFDPEGNLYFAFIAFQRTPPGQPSSTVANALAVAKYHIGSAGAVTYRRTVVVERGTVGLGQQEDKEALAVDRGNGRVYVCWARFTGVQNHLSVKFSSDGGDTWNSSRFSGPQGEINNMQGCNLAVAPNHDVYVSWRTFDNNPSTSNPNDSAIFVARSSDGGATFSAPVQVATFVDYRQNASRTPPRFRVFANTTLAADANGVYVGWAGRSGANGADVFISRSKTNGETWETPVKPTAGAGAHQIMPSLAAAGGKLSAIWYDSRSEPAFTASGPVTGQCPSGATTGAGVHRHGRLLQPGRHRSSGRADVRGRAPRHRPVVQPQPVGLDQGDHTLHRRLRRSRGGRHDRIRGLDGQPRREPHGERGRGRGSDDRSAGADQRTLAGRERLLRQDHEIGALEAEPLAN
jgi:hypothetical protein